MTQIERDQFTILLGKAMELGNEFHEWYMTHAHRYDGLLSGAMSAMALARQLLIEVGIRENNTKADEDMLDRCTEEAIKVVESKSRCRGGLTEEEYDATFADGDVRIEG